MHTAIVEFDSLPNPIWTTTQYNNFLSIAWLRLTNRQAAGERYFIRGVHIRSLRREFCGTSIDPPVDGVNTVTLSLGSDIGHINPSQCRETRICKAQGLKRSPTHTVTRQPISLYCSLHRNNFPNLLEKPGVVAGRLTNLF